MKKEPDCYAVRLKDLNEVRRSRSGGFFISLCKYVIDHGGVVYGCSGADPHCIAHTRAETLDDCECFRNSKYVQSRLSETFLQCVDDLSDNRIVLFSGTGCQIHGLICFLKVKSIDTSRLITVDLVCHGVPSPGIWQTYMKQLEVREKKKIIAVNFRDKAACGWKAHKEKIVFEDGTSRLEDVWTNLFYSNTILRPSCSKCPYASTVRYSDFTIADYWGIENNAKQFDDDKGVNLVLINSKHGRTVFTKLTDIEYQETLLQNSLQPNLCKPSMVDLQKRQRVMKDYVRKSHRYFVRKYLTGHCWFYISAKIRNKWRAIRGAKNET